VGKVACWGDLGEEKPNHKPMPVPLPGASAEVEVGDRFACARLVSGGVHCWGTNGDGQLGDGTSGDDRPRPVVVRGLSHVARIAIGIQAVCALVSGGRVTCWGWQMGEGGDIAKLPTDVVPKAK
jgi:alpha-tubulin suppressor-like RCC1 family protein